MATPNRSPERLRHHYEVEKELAAKLRGSSREERTELFKTLYTELFERVPDHPRLTRRDTQEDSLRNIARQMRLLKPHLQTNSVLLEIAPGDCRLSYEAARQCEKVIGVDISDQRAPEDLAPNNFELIVYDGYHLDLPENSVDIAFSYQFLEHLHPEDVPLHFEMIHRLLKPGGVYVFDTPHRFSGPHDVSKHFGDTLEGFHFQEWTYREMRKLLRHHGFGKSRIHRKGQLIENSLLNAIHNGIESVVEWLPKSVRRRIASRLFPAVTLSAWKKSSRN